MGTRVQLQGILEKICGCKHVYFQPPSNLCMKYPAIRYELADIGNSYADDSVYMQNRRYSITVIDQDPESRIVEEISKLPTSKFSNSYPADGLYHTVFNLYF